MADLATTYDSASAVLRAGQELHSLQSALAVARKDGHLVEAKPGMGLVSRLPAASCLPPRSGSAGSERQHSVLPDEALVARSGALAAVIFQVWDGSKNFIMTAN